MTYTYLTNDEGGIKYLRLEGTKYEALKGCFMRYIQECFVKQFTHISERKQAAEYQKVHIAMSSCN